MRLQNIGKFKLQFEYKSDVYDIFVTKYSTCNDVIHMILHKSGIPPSQVKAFALYEKTGSVERILHGHALVYKIWRSWGCEKNNFRFLVKDSERRKGTENQIVTSTVEGHIDHIYNKHYSKVSDSMTLKRSSRQSSLIKCVESVPYAQNAGRHDAKVTSESQLSGKQIVLGRYLYDVLKVATSNKQSICDSLLVRESGDGKENSIFLTGNDVTYGRKNSVPGFIDNSGSSGVDDAQTMNDSNEFSNEYNSVDSECASCVGETVTLDTAFVKTSYDSDSDEGIDVTSVESVDLDAAFIDETTKFKIDSDLDNVLATFDEISEPVNELYKSKSRSRSSMIKNFFAKDERLSEDDEMESFMHSRIEY
ncbi:Peptidylglycine alpha-amidating monooxygenase COOH-terminal interactor protein-1 [Mactra antiquata]